jgi:fumarate hydratase class II
MTFRTEQDMMGEMEVPEGIYYGSQTARSLLNFDIGIEKIPQELIVAFGFSKKATRIAKKAHVEGTTLKDAAVTLGFLSTEEFDSIVIPAKMTGPQKPDIEKAGRTGKS